MVRGRERARNMTRSPSDHAAEVLGRLWALAQLFHLGGNSGGLVGGGLLATTEWGYLAASFVLFLRPQWALSWYLVAGSQLLNVIAEIPLFGSHVAVLALGNIGILVFGLSRALFLREFRLHASEVAAGFAEVSRPLAIAVYFFAALAKTNADFLNPETSCATSIAGNVFASLGGVPGLPWIVLLWEWAIVVLLVVRRTRLVGVFVAVSLHFVLGLDRSFHFWDFSSVMCALLASFFGPERLQHGSDLWRAETERRPWLRVVVPLLVGVYFVLFPLSVVSRSALRAFTVYPAWLMFSLAVVFHSVRQLRRDLGLTSPLPRLSARSAHVMVVAALAYTNGLSPYFEVKTAYAFNMYSNLRTERGKTNHLLLRTTLPLVRYQFDTVEILGSSDRGLRGYANDGYRLPFLQLRAYLSAHPDTGIMFLRGGKRYTYAKAREEPSLVEPVPGWKQKLHMYRALDTNEEKRCLERWKAAH